MFLSEQLRAAIQESGLSATALSKECGIPQPMLTRFINGLDVRLATAEKLAAYFELELQPRNYSVAHLAKLLNISETSIRVADKVRANGIPEIADAVWKGTLELSDAEKIASKPRDKQLELLRKALKRK